MTEQQPEHTTQPDADLTGVEQVDPPETADGAQDNDTPLDGEQQP